MKSSISFFFVIICTVVLAAQQSQAKKGCNAYGHACYGGHGKRSLGALMGVGGSSSTSGSNSGGGSTSGSEQEDMRPNAILQVFPNEMTGGGGINDDGEFDAYPRYRLIKIMKSWFGNHARRPAEHFSEFEYPNSAENFNRDNISFN